MHPLRAFAARQQALRGTLTPNLALRLHRRRALSARRRRDARIAHRFSRPSYADGYAVKNSRARSSDALESVVFSFQGVLMTLVAISNMIVLGVLAVIGIAFTAEVIQRRRRR